MKIPFLGSRSKSGLQMIIITWSWEKGASCRHGTLDETTLGIDGGLDNPTQLHYYSIIIVIAWQGLFVR